MGEPDTTAVAAAIGRRPAPDRHAPAWSFERALKERAVEEPVNLYWHRRLAYPLLLPFQQASWLTPCGLTLLSGLFGVASAIAAYRAAEHSDTWFAIAGLLLLGSSVLDCADGMLARLRGQASRLGMLLDGLTDYVVGLSCCYGLAHACWTRFPSPWVWPAAATIVLSTILHVALYEHYKGRYLAWCAERTPPGDVSASAGRTERTLEAMRGVLYDRVAEVLVAAPDPSGGPVVDLETRRRHFAFPMRLASCLGLGTHLSVVYLAAMSAAWVPGALLLVATLAITIGLNLLMLAAIRAWAKAERQYQGPLNA